MTRSHHAGRALAALVVSTIALAMLAAPITASFHLEAPSVSLKGKVPKAFKSLDFRWYGDDRESASPGSGLPEYGDMEAVGVAFTEGPGKARQEPDQSGNREKNRQAAHAASPGCGNHGSGSRTTRSPPIWMVHPLVPSPNRYPSPSLGIRNRPQSIGAR